MEFKLAEDPDVQEECSDEDEGATSEISSTCEVAMRKKNMRQQEQAKKATKLEMLRLKVELHQGRLLPFRLITGHTIILKV